FHPQSFGERGLLRMRRDGKLIVIVEQQHDRTIRYLAIIGGRSRPRALAHHRPDAPRTSHLAAVPDPGHEHDALSRGNRTLDPTLGVRHPGPDPGVCAPWTPTQGVRARTAHPGCALDPTQGVRARTAHPGCALDPTQGVRARTAHPGCGFWGAVFAADCVGRRN